MRIFPPPIWLPDLVKKTGFFIPYDFKCTEAPTMLLLYKIILNFEYVELELFMQRQDFQ